MNIYRFLCNVGVTEDQDKSHQKKVRVINMSCILWYHALILTSVIFFFVRDHYGLPMLFNFCGFLIVVSSHLFNKKGHSSTAAFLILVFSALYYLVITCYIAQGRFVEFFYIVLPCASVMFFKKLWQSIVILVLCIVLFHIPFLVFGFYEREGVLFLPPLMIFLFITVFMVVVYFRFQNEKNEALLKKDKDLIQLQKKELEELNDFKSKFFVNVSHELRTPITIIDGFAQHILRNKNADHVSGVEKIIGQTHKIKEMVDQILDLSKMKLNKFIINKANTNLNELLSKLHASFLPLFTEKEIQFHLNLNDDVIANLDAVYLERAISNIILNSLKYTEKGHVTLSLAYLKMRFRL